MSVELTYYGHAAFGLSSAGASILIDPFFSNNPQAAIAPDQAKADYILITHGHGDHIGDALSIAQRTGATIISNFEICRYCESQGCRIHALHIGGGYDFPFGRVKLTIAHHGSSLPDGSYGGSPAGVLLTLDSRTIYHAGDTGLFYDMKLIGEEGVDVAILPIGDNFTMGPADALRAVKLIDPLMVIPIHFNTFDVITQDPQAFASKVSVETRAQCTILNPGESITL